MQSDSFKEQIVEIFIYTHLGLFQNIKQKPTTQNTNNIYWTLTRGLTQSTALHKFPFTPHTLREVLTPPLIHWELEVCCQMLCS